MIFMGKDYNERIRDLAGDIPFDEPVFLIRASDIVGAEVVRLWAHLAKVAGAKNEIVAAAIDHAELMAAWPDKKVPDLPE